MRRALCDYYAPEHACVPLQRSQLGRHCAVAVVTACCLLSQVKRQLNSQYSSQPLSKDETLKASAFACPCPLINSALFWLCKGGHVDDGIALLSVRVEPSTHSALARSPSAFHSDIIFRAFLAAFKVGPLSSASFRTLSFSQGSMGTFP